MQETKPEAMTEKQEAYLAALLESRVCPASVSGELEFLKALNISPDKATASKYITALQGAPYKPKTVTVSNTVPEVTVPASTYVPASVSGGAHVTVQPTSKSKWQQWEDMPCGYYTVEGSFYSYGDTGVAVYLISMQKKKYGAPRKIVRRLWKSYEGKPKWQTLSYPTAVQNLAGHAPVDIATVAKLGLNFGFCCCCLRTLTDPFSVQNGIGPVCAKTWGYAPASMLAG